MPRNVNDLSVCDFFSAFGNAVESSPAIIGAVCLTRPFNSVDDISKAFNVALEELSNEDIFK